MGEAPGLAGSREHFAVLDGLRGVAALAVLLGHASTIVLGHSFVERKLLAVEFFFMLSGFVVTFAYEARLKHGMSAAEFVRRRIIRLYPMIGIAVVAAIVVQTLLDRETFSPARTLSLGTLGALALPNPLHLAHGQPFPLDPPEWSVFYEMLVSLAFGIFLFRASSRVLIALIAGTSAGLLTALVVYTDHIPFALHVFGAVATFAAGTLLCRLYLSGALVRWRTRSPVPSPVLAALLVAACATPRSAGSWVDVFAVVALFPLIVVAGALAKPSSRSLDRWIGELSYPLYILHWPVLIVARDLLAPRYGNATAIAGGCIAALSCAWAAYIFIDKPIRRWLSGKFLPAKHATTALANPSYPAMDAR